MDDWDCVNGWMERLIVWIQCRRIQSSRPSMLDDISTYIHLRVNKNKIVGWYKSKSMDG
jgi:hypothetical protein